MENFPSSVGGFNAISTLRFISTAEYRIEESQRYDRIVFLSLLHLLWDVFSKLMLVDCYFYNAVSDTKVLLLQFVLQNFISVEACPISYKDVFH
jgi:hypothetical protein